MIRRRPCTGSAISTRWLPSRRSASTRTAAASLAKSVELSRAGLAEFDKTVGTFNAGVHDFAEVDYNLRGSVERMDLVVRDLASALREINRRLAGTQK